MTNGMTSVVCADPTVEPGAIGIKRIEVSEPDQAHPDRKVTVLVTFTPLPADVADLSAAQLLDHRSYALTGGARLHPHITSVEPVPTRADQALLHLDQQGDFSVYRLTLLNDRADPLMSSVALRFRLACEHPFDCRPAAPPPPPPTDPGVVIDYLAKDYSSFRQALLDFLPTRLPEWTERSEADVGIVLLELLAATGDSLSYLQDRVANEAFLGTATQRRSVQGHLSLLGYVLDEGASSYAWLQFQVARRHRLRPGFAVSLPASGRLSEVVFETLVERVLDPEQNDMRIYDGGNADCLLPRDGTTAVLLGSFDTLTAGDYLVFRDDSRGLRDIVRLVSEPIDIAPPPSSLAAGARHLTQVRWSVRTPLHHDYCVADTAVQGNLVLATDGSTQVQNTTVPGTRRLPPSTNVVVSPPEGPPGTTFVMSAFGFPLDDTVIEYTLQAPDGQNIGTTRRRNVTQPGGLDGETISIAPGALAAVWRVTFTGLPSNTTTEAYFRVTGPTPLADGALQSGWLRIPLEQGPLAHVDSTVIDLIRPVTGGPIAAPGGYVRRSIPQLRLLVDGVEWQAVPTLLESGPSDEVYRIEVDDEGSVMLVFGRGGEGFSDREAFGRRPAAGVPIQVTFRVGGGARGNVAADLLTRPLTPTDPQWFIAVANPLRAAGGRDPESRAHAAQAAPRTIQHRLVAVTPDDYEAAALAATDAQGLPLVARARAAFRWTGSWLTVALTIDPRGTQQLTPDTETALLRFLDGRRLAGYDLQLRAADYVPIQLTLRICVRPNVLGSDVQRDLELALSAKDLGNGKSGFFFPDNFSFGTPLAISRLYDAVLAVRGVESTVIETLAPLHAPQPQASTASAKASGYLTVGADQVLQLDNDPNFPERGRLTLIMLGGR
jgi:hypothetical protein